jgi:hypothetical protein
MRGVTIGSSLLAVAALAGCSAGGDKPLREPGAATAMPGSVREPEPTATPSAVSAPAPEDGGSAATDGGSSSSASAAAPGDAGAPLCAGGTRRVVEASGNLTLCEADGTSRPLTTGGQDEVGSLSPDGRRVVFLRMLGKQRIRVGTTSIEIADNRVMVLDPASGAVTEVARNDARDGCLSLWNPRFADDGAVILEAHGYEQPTVHNLSVCVADLRARTLRVVGTGTRCTIFITAGRYRGSFYVSTLEIGNAGQLSFTELVDRHGRVVRKLDGNPFAVDWNGDGAIQGDETMPECLDPPPPQAALEAIMKKL